MEKEVAFHTTDGRHAEHPAKRKEVLMLKTCVGSRGYLIHPRLLNKPESSSADTGWPREY